MKKNNKKVIKVLTDDISYMDSMDFDIKYWSGGWYSTVDINEFLDTIIELNEKILNKIITREDILLEFVKNDWSITEIWEDHLEDYEKEAFDNDIEIFKTEGTAEIADIALETIEIKDFEIIAELFDCNFGTVGYSPWAYFLSWKDVDHNFVRDIYEGWNWYSLQLLDMEGNFEDSISGIYAASEKDLLTAIKDHFGLSEKEFYIVDNDNTTYFNLEKVKEIQDINYSYQVV